MVKEIEGYSAYVEIDLDRVEHNYKTAREKLCGDTDILAIVKADAYNHGAVRVASKLYSCGARYFAVANTSEALELRDNGIGGTILVLGPMFPPNYSAAIQNDISITVDSLQSLKSLSEYVSEKGVSARMHIALNSGMNRIGFMAHKGMLSDELKQSAEIIKNNNLLITEGIFSHFCNYADEEFTKTQFARFSETVSMLEELGLNFKFKHMCSSTGTLKYPEYHLDLVRYGIALYGCEYDDEDVLPVMSFKSRINHVTCIKKGEGVGYGQTYIAERDMKIATVSVGYADGYNRLLSNCGYMLVRGKKAPIIGRVCMDMTMIDISGIDDAAVGDTVTLIGCDGKESITAEQLAETCGTISYEILCNLGKRVNRVYIEKNK